MKVTLVTHTHDPVDSICLAISIMKDKNPLEYVSRMTEQQKEAYVNEILKTRLRGALEFASFVFYLEDVSRTFTHQLVRHRAFSFSQQSMRFFDASESRFIAPTEDMFLQAAAQEAVNNYTQLLKTGIAIQDARSVLPQNIATNIMFRATFRGLVELAEVRMCQQTQGEFRTLMQHIKASISQVSPFLGGLLVPVCDRSGVCEFKSIFDRPCPRQERLKGGNSGNDKETQNQEVR